MEFLIQESKRLRGFCYAYVTDRKIPFKEGKYFEVSGWVRGHLEPGDTVTEDMVGWEIKTYDYEAYTKQVKFY
jgi:hypothetical protein